MSDQQERRDPEQRKFFKKIMDLVVHITTRTKLAVIKHIFRSIEKDIDDEDKKDGN